MFKQESKDAAILASSKYFMTYPQISHKQKNKMCFIRSLKQTMHISTPLIVVINFYI